MTLGRRAFHSFCWIGKSPLTPIVALIVLLSAAPGLAAEPATSSGVIGDLKDVPQFSELFNRDAGHPRLVLLLSPT